MDINKYASMKLRELRMQKHISQKELAEELGITQQQVARFENNRRKFKQDFLYKLASFFDVSINDFFPYNENDYNKIIMAKVNTLTDEQKQKVINMIDIIK